MAEFFAADTVDQGAVSDASTPWAGAGDPAESETELRSESRGLSGAASIGGRAPRVAVTYRWESSYLGPPRTSSVVSKKIDSCLSALRRMGCSVSATISRGTFRDGVGISKKEVGSPEEKTPLLPPPPEDLEGEAPEAPPLQTPNWSP